MRMVVVGGDGAGNAKAVMVIKIGDGSKEREWQRWGGSLTMLLLLENGERTGL